MDKHQKKQIKRYIAWGCLALMVLLLSVMPLLAGKQAEEDGPQASILDTTVTLRDIETRIIGGGQLTSETAREVTVPEAIKLTKYLVNNGDTVKKGDPIARVDKVSVMLALEEVQKTLDHLSGELASISSDTEPDEITAQAGGLVKILYAKKGDSVRDVMLEHGALAVLSLDGRMAVDIETDKEFSYGEKMTVILENGSKVNGKVESCVAGMLTVSVKDKDYAIGQNVAVSTKDGQNLGNGELYIHSPWNAAAYYGTVSKVAVKEGQTLSAGKTLMQLDVSGHSSQFQILVSQRQEYEELIQELFAMYETGVVTAPCDGFVSGVDKDGAFLLAADSMEQEWFFQPLSGSTDSDWVIMPLSETGEDTPDGDKTPPGGETPPVDPDTGDPAPDGGEEEKPNVSIITAALPQGTVGQPYTAGVQASDGAKPIVEGTWTQQGLPAGLNIDPATGGISGTPTAAGNYVVTISFTCEKGTATKQYALLIVPASTQMPGTQIPGGMDFSGMLSGFGGFGNFGGYNAAPAFEPYSLETVTVASVTTQEKMTLEIAVDEQDISRIYLGQEATVTVEALTGQSFPATVTSISNTGTNGGGSSKFTAKLTLSKAGDMLPGMNASAFLPLDTIRSVPTVPVAALVEKGSRTIIYTGYDTEKELLTDPVTVTTGASDGEYVQILSGLSEGDKIRYAYYDTLELSPVPKQGFGF